MKKGLIKIIILILIILSFILIVKHYHLKQYLSVAGFNNYREELMLFKINNLKLFILGYIVSYVMLIACCIPGTILFDLLAGFMFGYFAGTGLVIFSYITGATLNFIIIKYIFKDFFFEKFSKLRNSINLGSKSNVLLNLIGLRLIPIIPFWALNIVAALLNIRLSVFFISTLIGIIPVSLIYVIMGDGVHELLNNNQALTMKMIMDPKIWLPLFSMSILLFIPGIVKYVKNRAKSKNLAP